MEQIDLSKELIADSEYYLPYSIYSNFLKKNNITTVDQILKGEFDKASFLGHRMHYRTASKLRVFVSLIRYKYLGEPLPIEAYLDKVIDLDNSKLLSFGEGSIALATPVGKYNSINVTSFFGCDVLYLGDCFKDFLIEKRAEISYYKKNNMPVIDVLVVDFFKWIVSKDNKYSTFVPFAKTYIEAYNKNQIIVDDSNEVKVITLLKDELAVLLKRRDSINKQISIVEQQIEFLLDNKSKGGVDR